MFVSKLQQQSIWEGSQSPPTLKQASRLNRILCIFSFFIAKTVLLKKAIWTVIKG